MLKLSLGGRAFGRSMGPSIAYRWLVAVSAVAVFLWLVPVDLAAQAPEATRLEMRHFWHVFIAYALAWIILFAWIVSILRRFRRLEEKLD